MNIYTIHSDSHKVWYKVLKDSLKANCKDFKIHSRITKQVSKTGEYGSDDIIKFWYLKVKYILEALEVETEPFLYSDTDIYFFRDFNSDL